MQCLPQREDEQGPEIGIRTASSKVTVLRSAQISTGSRATVETLYAEPLVWYQAERSKNRQEVYIPTSTDQTAYKTNVSVRDTGETS